MHGAACVRPAATAACRPRKPPHRTPLLFCEHISGTAGTTGRFVQYMPFIQDLEKLNFARGAAASSAHASASPSPMPTMRYSPASPPPPVGGPSAAPQPQFYGEQFDFRAAGPPAAAAALPPVPQQRPVSPASGLPLNHYLQNLLSPRSRSEFDDFNRFHFSQLRLNRSKDSITPKVRCIGSSGGRGS